MSDTSKDTGLPQQEVEPVTESEQALDEPESNGNVNHLDHAEEQIDFILDIPLEIRVELGRTRMQINELLKLGQGSVIELGKSAGENLEILANNRLIAKGEVVVTKDKYAIRLTEIISPMERVQRLK